MAPTLNWESTFAMDTIGKTVFGTLGKSAFTVRTSTGKTLQMKTNITPKFKDDAIAIAIKPVSHFHQVLPLLSQLHLCINNKKSNAYKIISIQAIIFFLCPC